MGSVYRIGEFAERSDARSPRSGGGKLRAGLLPAGRRPGSAISMTLTSAGCFGRGSGMRPGKHRVLPGLVNWPER